MTRDEENGAPEGVLDAKKLKKTKA